MKDYLLVSICDQELCSQGLAILHNFLTADALKFQVYEESRDIFLKSLELLYQGDSNHCKTKFKEYIMTKVLGRNIGDAATASIDNSLKKFFKGIIQKFSEEQSVLYQQSNITDVL